MLLGNSLWAETAAGCPCLWCMADQQGEYPRLLRDLCTSGAGEGEKHPTTWGYRGRRRDRRADVSGQPFAASVLPFLCQRLPREVPPRRGCDLSRPCAGAGWGEDAGQRVWSQSTAPPLSSPSSSTLTLLPHPRPLWEGLSEVRASARAPFLI